MVFHGHRTGPYGTFWELPRDSFSGQCVQIHRRLLSRHTEVVLAEDVVAVEHAAGDVPRHGHGDALGHPGPAPCSGARCDAGRERACRGPRQPGRRSPRPCRNPPRADRLGGPDHPLALPCVLGRSWLQEGDNLPRTVGELVEEVDPKPGGHQRVHDVTHAVLPRVVIPRRWIPDVQASGRIGRCPCQKNRRLRQERLSLSLMRQRRRR